MNYRLKLSTEAEKDFEIYIDYILIDCAMPITAAKHKADILEILFSLTENPQINPIRYSPFLHKFGKNVRRANYKKMAIIYTVNKGVIYIHRIIAASMIIA